MKYTAEIFDELIAAYEELVDTFKDILDGYYEPDLFQLNRAEAAIAAAKGDPDA